MVLSQLHRNVNQTARKEHPDNIKLAKDCTVTIVCRKVGAEGYGGSGSWLGRVRRLVDVDVVILGG